MTISAGSLAPNPSVAHFSILPCSDVVAADLCKLTVVLGTLTTWPRSEADTILFSEKHSDITESISASSSGYVDVPGDSTVGMGEVRRGAGLGLGWHTGE